MNADGSGQTRLTNAPGTEQDFRVWSSDRANRLPSFRDGNWEIYAMNPDGSGFIGHQRPSG